MDRVNYPTDGYVQMRPIIIGVQMLLWSAAQANEATPRRAKTIRSKKGFIMLSLRSTSPFHAVEIASTVSACTASRHARGQRYRSAEAPRLPLDKCDRSDQCKCRYKHHDDRRVGSRRNADVGLPSQNNPNQIEQRHGKDRRAEHTSQEDDSFILSDVSYYDYSAKVNRARAQDR